jgi:hypothetical protein
VATSDGDAGDALDVDVVGDEDEDCEVGGGSASPFEPQADTAANRTVPVAHVINPSRIFM